MNAVGNAAISPRVACASAEVSEAGHYVYTQVAQRCISNDVGDVYGKEL